MGTVFNPMNVMMGNPGKAGLPYFGGGPPKAGQFSSGPSTAKPSTGGSVGPVVAGQFGGGSPAQKPGSEMIRAGEFSGQPPTGGTSPQPPNMVGPESIRATGTGPFDDAYRQDLATYAGGLFGRPGGNLSFNPTSNQPFGGAATGGGNAPVLGMPNTLLQNALGGNPFSYTPPPTPTPTPADGNPFETWLKQFMNQGSGFRAPRVAARA